MKNKTKCLKRNWIKAISIIALITTVIIALCVILKTRTGIQVIKQIALMTLQASTSTTEDFTYYELSDGTLEINGYTGTASNVIIPSEIDGKKVTSIGYNAFYYKNMITNVEIPDGITTIGERAFRNCSNLLSINIPEGVTSIKANTFEGCSALQAITIPSTVTSIGSYAFYGCNSLTTIKIPEGVTSIGRWAFACCSSLLSINIPEGVTTIEEATFYACTALQSIKIPSSVTTIEGGAFNACTALLTIDLGEGLTTIGEEVFINCSNLQNITLPNTLTTIGNRAFESCSSLQSITLPSTVTTIGDKAFNSCKSLLSIDIPEGVEVINEYTFSNCSNLTTITLPSTLTNIGNYAFNSTAITNITIPNKVTTIGSSAFTNSSLKNIEIPESVTSIGSSAFYSCSMLEKVKILGNITKIETKTFYGCNKLTNIQLPDTITTIAESAFEEVTSLEEIDLPDNLNTIGTKAFYKCNKLKNIVIPDSVISIGNSAFYQCYALQNATLSNTLISIGNGAFYQCTSLINIELPDSLTSMGTSMFSGCSSLERAKLPKNLQILPDLTFSQCSKLSQVELPDTLISIGYDSFWYCRNLKDITIPNKVTKIGNRAFSGTGLTKIEIPESVTNIGTQAFYSIGYIENLIIPNKSIGIASNAFGLNTLKQIPEFNSKEETNMEIDILKRVKTEDDVLYTTQEFTLSNCTITEEGNVNIKAKDLTSGKATIKINGGALENLTLEIPRAELENIEIAEEPSRTTYIEGQVFDKTGMKVAGNYSYGINLEATNYTTNPTRSLTTTDTEITVSYKDNGIIKTAVQSINVIEKELTGIEITTEPSKTAYIEGETFNKYGMVVTARYNDESSKTITNYTTAPEEALTLDNKEITISYTEEGITKTATQEITVREKQLSEITVKTLPTKVKYIQGSEELDLTGGIITLKYDNGTSEEKGMTEEGVIVTGFDNTELGTKTLTVSYEEKTAIFNITIIAKELTKIEITTEPSKVNYIEGQTFDKTGMIVTATYNDGDSKEVTDYTPNIIRGLTTLDKEIIISYTENNITKTAVQKISVVEKSLSNITIKNQPTKLTYVKSSDNLDLTGGVITLNYNNGTSEEKGMTEEGVTVTGFDNTKLGTQTLTVSYKEKSTTFEIKVVAKELTGIEITSPAIKTNYIEGETFDRTGMVVAATYSDGSTKDITEEVTITYFRLTLGCDFALVKYTEDEITKMALQPITVTAKSLESIEIKTAPTKLTYVQSSDSLNLTGGVITLNYNNGTSEEKGMTEEGVTVTGFDNTNLGTQTLTVIYEEKTTTFEVEIIEKELTKIEITTEPSKTSYIEGETFDKTGMIVTAIYNDGSTKDVTNDIKITEGIEKLTVENEYVTIRYIEDEVMKTAIQPIIVNEKTLSSIAIKKLPTRLSYLKSNESLDLAGGVILLNYNNGATEEKGMTEEGVTVTGFDNSKVGKQTLTVNYEGKTTTFEIEIIAKELTGIKITTEPSKTSYIEGETFDKTGMIVTATYSDGSTKDVTNDIVITEGLGKLTVENEYVTIRYEENEKWAKAIQTIKVTKSTIVSDELEIDGGIIKLQPKTTLDIFKTKITANATSIKVYNQENEEIKEKDLITTGMTLKLNDKVEYKLIVRGDVNSDGDANFMDILLINKHRLINTKLEENQLIAADVNEDEKADILDILSINKYRLGRQDKL